MAKQFVGFLFSKLAHIGSKSEGPAYFLQKSDYTELPIKKHAQLWEVDPALQKLLATKVTVEGEMVGDTLIYTSVKPH